MGRWGVAGCQPSYWTLCLSICEGDIFIDFLENLQGSDFEGGKRVEGEGEGIFLAPDKLFLPIFIIIKPGSTGKSI